MIKSIRRALDERDKGFTLIELLVVIIIIGVLSAIAVPVFLNQRKKGVDASLKSDLKNGALVAEQYTALTQGKSCDAVGGKCPEFVGAAYRSSTTDDTQPGGGVEFANAAFESPRNREAVHPVATAAAVGSLDESLKTLDTNYDIDENILKHKGWKISPGNEVFAFGGTLDGYCLLAWNAGATTAVDRANALYYDSTGGGFMKRGTQCDPAAFFNPGGNPLGD